MANLTITGNNGVHINITADRIVGIPGYNGMMYSCANVTAVTGGLRNSYPAGTYTGTIAGTIPYRGRWLIIRNSPATHLAPDVGRAIRVLISNNDTQPTLT